ncbi:MAG: hypothetical protein JWN99_352 [Ilumatobacteraceae bacterium]|nr:hypothetical protein [Ilumatobacteraceae bacterium]
MTNVVHLAKRFAGSLSRKPPIVADDLWAKGWMTPWEIALWRRMTNVDQRHAIVVARRFQASRPEATSDEMAAALLHDVGKIESGLGTFGRVAATLIGPRTRRFRTYHDHEAIGAKWLHEQGSSAATVDLIRRQGVAAATLESADDI